MDAVITYVNGADPLWQAAYGKVTGDAGGAKRFRDWGTLRYLLRGIETFLPFVEHVCLVVSGESQVPAWASGNLRPVFHREIIPARCLPLFNSTSIELFLHRIPGLSDQFLYFNDDMFPTGACRETDFFDGGKAVCGFATHLFADSLYRRHCRNSDRLARKALGMAPACFFKRPQHVCSPMLRSESEKAFAAVEADLMASVTPVRDVRNVNQYFFQDYLYYAGKAIDRRLPAKHLSLALPAAGRVEKALFDPRFKQVCINDVNLPEARLEGLRARVDTAFRRKFPQPSRFER